jgi:hypothetical protein
LKWGAQEEFLLQVASEDESFRPSALEDKPQATPFTEKYLAAFFSLSRSRGVGMGGPLSLSLADIEAFARLVPAVLEDDIIEPEQRSEDVADSESMKSLDLFSAWVATLAQTQFLMRVQYALWSRSFDFIPTAQRVTQKQMATGIRFIRLMQTLDSMWQEDYSKRNTKT